MCKDNCCDRYCCFSTKTASRITSGATLIFTLFICVVSGLLIKTEGRLENYFITSEVDIWSILADPYVATVIVYGVWSISAFLGLVGSIHDLKSLLVLFFVTTVAVLGLHVVAYIALLATEKYKAYFFTPLHVTLFVFGIVIIIAEVYGQISVVKHVKYIMKSSKLKLEEQPTPHREQKVYYASDFKKRGVEIESPVFDDKGEDLTDI